MEESEVSALPESAQVNQKFQKKMSEIKFSHLQKVIDVEEHSSNVSHSKVELQSLTTRNYLDHTVVPILLDAMSVVARERCVS